MSQTKPYLATHHGQPTPRARLDESCRRLRRVARDVNLCEGRLLDYETADGIQRALHATLRELEELTLTLAVMERRRS